MKLQFEDSGIDIPDSGKLDYHCKPGMGELFANCRIQFTKLGSTPAIELMEMSPCRYGNDHAHIHWLYLVWAEPRQEWVGVKQLLDTDNPIEKQTYGPMALDTSLARKILEAYGETGEFSWDQVLHTPPEELRRKVFPKELKQELPHYTIHRLIGEGATRRCYLAKYKDEHRVIKLLKPKDEIKDQTHYHLEKWELNREEVDALQELHHENLARLYDWDDQGRYLIEQYVEGETLKQRLQREGEVLPGKLGFFNDLLEGVAYLHRLGYVHRGIKPSNVMLSSEGERTRALLTDFQTVRRRDGSGENSSYVGPVFGRKYASPELHTQQKASASSDLYSIMLMLVECLSGKQPDFSEEEMQNRASYEKALADHVGESLQQIPADYFSPRDRAGLQAMLLRGLEYDPATRHVKRYDQIVKHHGGIPREPIWQGEFDLFEELRNRE